MNSCTECKHHCWDELVPIVAFTVGICSECITNWSHVPFSIWVLMRSARCSHCVPKAKVFGKGLHDLIVKGWPMVRVVTAEESPAANPMVKDCLGCGDCCGVWDWNGFNLSCQHVNHDEDMFVASRCFRQWAIMVNSNVFHGCCCGEVKWV